MKQPVDLARRFLAMAERDIKAFQKLSEDPEIDDEIVGFHAQQAVEKCLKAILSLHQVPFRRTHHLDELVDLLKDQNKPLPPDVEPLEVLNPFAIRLRDDFAESGALDRRQARRIIEAVQRWTLEQIR